MTVEKLISFIDRQTNNGDVYPREDIGVEEGIAFIHSFSNRDWLALRTLDFKKKSSLWIKCLIHLLDRTYTEEARQTIIHIALAGTKENFFDAMEYIREFKRDVTIYTWLKLKNRSAERS